MPRFSVVKNPTDVMNRYYKKGGYRIHDADPPEKTGEDVEGFGWVPARAGTKCSSYINWYKYRYNADAACYAMNARGRWSQPTTEELQRFKGTALARAHRRRMTTEQNRAKAAA